MASSDAIQTKDKMKPVIIGGATLYLGDCMDVLPFIEADVAIADPVYGISGGVGSGLRGSLRKQRKAKGMYDTDKFEDTPEYVRSVMVPALALAVKRFGRAAITSGLRNMWAYPQPDHCGTFQYPGSTTMSCWGPMLWQPILFYGRDPHQGRLSPDSITNCNDFDANSEHPCPKPFRSWTKLVARASVVGEVVCDYVMGSGTTGVSAIQLGRKFVGIEIEERYFEIACKRIEQAVAQGQLFAPEPMKQEQEKMF